MQRCPPEFIGVPRTTLQTWLTNLQQALQDLTVGGKLETAAYTQADMTRSVTYTRAQIPFIEGRIRLLASVLYPGQRRRPVRFMYR